MQLKFRKIGFDSLLIDVSWKYKMSSIPVAQLQQPAAILDLAHDPSIRGDHDQGGIILYIILPDKPETKYRNQA